TRARRRARARRGRAACAARAGGAADARRLPADPVVFLRQQIAGETDGPRLGAERRERTPEPASVPDGLMAAFSLRRLLAADPTLCALIALSFFIRRAAPGGPRDGERAMPPEVEANLARTYRRGEPVPMQFVRYLGALARGDLGPSFQYRDWSVNDLIAAG